MYTRYCQKKGWKVAVASESEGTVGGYKEVILEVSGEDVYGTLKFESGVHRVQRVPSTETQGRVHTSAATVAVMPEAEEVDFVLNPADDYVADFIKDINRSRVLTVGTLPLKKVSSKGITLSNDTSLEDAMKALVEAKKDSVTVVKGDEKLGSISMYDIVHAATRSSETAGEAVTYR